MTYLAFELDALNIVPNVAAASGLTAPEVSHGLLQLWAWCFRSESDRVQGVHLAGFFGGRDAAPALVAFGFLEPEGDVFRVRGAARYLRIKEGRRKGGRAAKKNLIPGGPKAGGMPRGKPRPEPRVSRAQAEQDPRLDLGLSPSTEHRAPNEKKGAGTRPSDLLVADFKAATGSDYLWQDAKDGVALAALLKGFPLDEVRARWRRALRLPGDEWERCRTVAQLRSKWNDLAGEAPKAVPLEHRPGRVL